MGGVKEFPDRMAGVNSLDGLLDALKYDEHGLLTVVVQDADNREVLMVAFANREAVQKTLQTGLMHYYSRSRKKMWLKGEESGHTQKLVALSADCDGDAVVAQVKQTSGACHLGYRSCFAFSLSPQGSMTITAQKLFDPAAVYKKKN